LIVEDTKIQIKYIAYRPVASFYQKDRTRYDWSSRICF